jgi:lipopolysaccharide export system protein LptA
MKTIIEFNLFLVVFLSGIIISQEQNIPITVIGDSLVGKNINGESIREVFGNVTLTQGNVVITCDKATQYLARNDAELIGNVVARQEDLTIYTQQGFYYGNLRKCESHVGLKLNDREVELTAMSGEYFFDLHKAVFEKNVKLYDSVSVLTSNKLTYFRMDEKAIAEQDVKITDDENIIFADSLEHYRNQKITFAFNNVAIKNKKNNSMIFGDHLEDYTQKSYTKIDVNPFLIQVDTVFINLIDTTFAPERIDTITIFTLDSLLIRSKVMESFRDTLNYFIATDSVEILKGSFASKNNSTILFRTENKIITKLINSVQPILWYDNSQLTGDSITIYLDGSRIKNLEIDKNSFLLSQNKSYPLRFDQAASDKIKIYFKENKISRSEFYNDSKSIYYLYDENEPNGLAKSSSESATIIFSNSKVDEVRLYGSPVSEYYPENQVENNERTFTLPGYKFIQDRPTKNSLLKYFDNRKKFDWNNE